MFLHVSVPKITFFPYALSICSCGCLLYVQYVPFPGSTAFVPVAGYCTIHMYVILFLVLFFPVAGYYMYFHVPSSICSCTWLLYVCSCPGSSYSLFCLFLLLATVCNVTVSSSICFCMYISVPGSVCSCSWFYLFLQLDIFHLTYLITHIPAAGLACFSSQLFIFL
jgi:hypothetical protein